MIQRTLLVKLFLLSAIAIACFGQENPKLASSPVVSKPADVKAKAKPVGTKASRRPQGNQASNATVFIDPATGRIRPPSAAEAEALSRKATPAKPAAATSSEFKGPGGAVGVKLGDDSLNYLVVTKPVEGKVVLNEVQGGKAAEAYVNTEKADSRKAAAQNPQLP